VRAALLALAVAVATLAVGAAPAASKPRECQGLMVCVPVKGPWVVVPTAQSVPRPQVEYQLSCPRGYVVGGLDAELSNRAIDVSFLGKVGSPVNPGITTSRAAVFIATYVGASARAASFRPHVGCIPGSGGGRFPTANAVFRPGQPMVRRVLTARIRPATVQHFGRSCTRRERLIGGSHALGFYTPKPPSGALAATVSGRQVLRRAGVTVSVSSDEALFGLRAVVQVHALCSKVP
jgi:hypothetical protein